MQINVIGAGISGRALAFHFENLGEKVKVFDFGHSCSKNSMPYVSLFGIEKGISALGDLLYSSYFAFADFFEKHGQIQGVEKVEHYFIYDENSLRFSKRFGGPKELIFMGDKVYGKKESCFLIDPEVFLEWLYPNKKIIKKKVTKEIPGELSYYCTSSFRAKTSKEDKTKMSAGYFYQGRQDLGNQSFVLSTEFGNLTYCGQKNVVKLGASTEKNEILLPDFFGIAHIFHEFLKLIPALSQSNFNLSGGVRHKGVKRIPRLEKISQSSFRLDATYKNGWSIPFYAAQLWCS